MLRWQWLMLAFSLTRSSLGRSLTHHSLTNRLNVHLLFAHLAHGLQITQSVSQSLTHSKTPSSLVHSLDPLIHRELTHSLTPGLVVTVCALTPSHKNPCARAHTPTPTHSHTHTHTLSHTDDIFTHLLTHTHTYSPVTRQHQFEWLVS